MLKQIVIKILKRFANTGKMSADYKPNFAMRVFLYLNGKKIAWYPDLNRLTWVSSTTQANKKFIKHPPAKVSKVKESMYILLGEKVFYNNHVNTTSVFKIEHDNGIGTDKMKIFFTKSGTIIKLNKNEVSNKTIDEVLNLIKNHIVNRPLHSKFIKISKILETKDRIKLYTNVYKTHTADYDVCEHKIINL